jgi:hypothetical protein
VKYKDCFYPIENKKHTKTTCKGASIKKMPFVNYSVKQKLFAKSFDDFGGHLEPFV